MRNARDDSATAAACGTDQLLGSKVDNIRIPMLIAQGANDPRVKRAESDQMVKAIRARGGEVEYLVFKDEGHGFVRPENRIKYYAAIGRKGCTGRS